MGTEQALRGKIRITQGEAQRLKVLLRDAHNRLHHEVRKQVSEVYASLGDNRSNSSDSRSHRELNNGQVPVKSVVGTVSARMWPNPNWLEVGGPVFDRVPDTQDSN